MAKVGEDFLSYLGKANPFLKTMAGRAGSDRSPGADSYYPDWASVVNGTAWRNNEIGKRSALTTPASTSKRFSLLSLTKDPATQTLLDSAVGRLGESTKATGDLLGKFNLNLGSNFDTNTADIGQESASVNNVFGGGLGDKLKDSNQNYFNTATETNSAADHALESIRKEYGLNQTDAIKLLYSNLGKHRDEYGNQVLGDIANEVSRRDADAKNFGSAARVATDQSIADASRENKAMFDQEGGGGSSYASRLGMGQRIRANTALTQALAELRMSNTEKELVRRGALTEQLGALKRGDITGEGQANIGLNSDLNSQDNRNFLTTLGRRQAVEDTVGGRDASNIAYVQGQQNALLGARAGLRRSALGDLGTGIAVNQNAVGNDLRNLGALGEIRRGNQFLGIDDGTGDGLPFPRIPNFSRGFSNPGFFNPGASGFEAHPAGSVPTSRAGATSGTQLTPQQELEYYNKFGEWPYGDPPPSLLASPSSGAGTGTPEFPAGRFFKNTIPLDQGYDGTDGRYLNAA